MCSVAEAPGTSLGVPGVALKQEKNKKKQKKNTITPTLSGE